MKKSKRIALLAVSLALCLCLAASALAEGMLSTLFNAGCKLLFNTDNATLNAHATFSYDGELFKTFDGKYIQDGVNSYMNVSLQTPKSDGTVYEGGYTVISNDGIAYFDYYSGYVACTNTLKNTEILQQKIAENENYARAYGFLENVNNNHLITGSSQSSTTYLRFLDAVFYDLEDVTEQWDLLEEEMKQVLADANDR